MAWVMKNSATAQIPRRSEPYLTEAMKQQAEAELIPRYPSRRAALLPLLHLLQDTYGYLPWQAIEEAALCLGISPAEAADTASFYEMFFLQPRGRYVIGVCQSLSCELMGQRQLMEALEKKLRIRAGQTTPDGKFTLMHVECLGACDGAPAAMVNDVLYERLTAENFERVLDSLP